MSNSSSATPTALAPTPPRKVCIIGAGLSGLGYLHALLDLPEAAREDWEIDVYEHRAEAGGIWTPQPSPRPPPEVPETPAYDDLECITLGAGVTFPNRPLPPSSLLFPSMDTIHTYIQDHIRDFNLAKYIHVGHTVTSTALDAKAAYPWSVSVRNSSGVTHTKPYSTVIAAIGITAAPRLLHLPGEAAWRAAGRGREILHSMWYRNPEVGRDRTVIVIGSHASGNHIAWAMSEVAREVHHVYVPDMITPALPFPTTPSYIHHSSRAIKYDPHELVLANGATIPTPPDALVIECTGYLTAHPFLPPEVLHRVAGDAFTWDSPTLESNERLIRPLLHCFLAIDPEIPAGSLAFACLFPIIWNLPTSYAQGLWLAHVLVDLDRGRGESKMLPSLDEAMEGIRAREEKQKAAGVDMTQRGQFVPSRPWFPHQAHGSFLIPPGITTDDLADYLIREIRQHSSYPLPAYLADPAREYTEPWRRRAFQLTRGLIKAWRVAKEQGIEASFSHGAKTEEDFAEALEKLQAWWEKESGEKPAGVIG